MNKLHCFSLLTKLISMIAAKIKRFSKSEKQIIAINKWLNHTTAQQNIH